MSRRELTRSDILSRVRNILYAWDGAECERRRDSLSALAAEIEIQVGVDQAVAETLGAESLGAMTAMKSGQPSVEPTLAGFLAALPEGLTVTVERRKG
jgi:hypothetical protein